MKKRLSFRFHDPNPAGVAVEYILKELIEANLTKVERVIREAKVRETVLKNSLCIKSSSEYIALLFPYPFCVLLVGHFADAGKKQYYALKRCGWTMLRL